MRTIRPVVFFITLLISVLVTSLEAASVPEPVFPVVRHEQCAMLQDPTLRQHISGALEFKLMLLCGEISQKELDNRRQRVVGDGSVALPVSTAALPNVLVNDPALDTGGTTQSETSIVAVGNIVCAAWNDAGEGLGANGFSGFGYSHDGGLTWTDGGSFPIGPGSDRSLGDPSLAFSTEDNAFYFASLSDIGLSIWKSVDNCQSFQYVAPIHVEFGFGDDKELMAVDNYYFSPFKGRIYVGWTNFGLSNDRNVVSFSDDGGLSWSTPSALPGSGTAGQGMWPAIGSNGDVYFALLNRSFSIGGLQDQWIYKSTDGGATWTQMTDIGTNQLRPESVLDSQLCGRQALTAEVRNLSSPQITIIEDATATVGYTIHAVYPYDSDGGGADDSNVFYRRSTDGAVTWSPEIMLNDDGTTTDQWFPAIAVGGNGFVVASWYDRRLDTPGNTNFDRYATFSTDGGLTWSPNVRISDVSSPVSQNNPHFDGLAGCYHGDYDQLAISGSTAHILWSDDRRITATGPNPDIYYGRIDPPKLLSVQRVGSSTVSQVSPIQLTWEYQSSLAADGFKIERCIGWGNCLNDIDFSEIITINDPSATSYLDDGQHPFGLDDGQLYTYRMRAFNAIVNTPYSSTWGVYTTLRPPANLAASATHGTEVVLTWTDVSANEGGFEVSRRCNSAPAGTECNGSYTVIGAALPDTESFTDQTVFPGASYTYRVRAFPFYYTLPGMHSFYSVTGVTTPNIPSPPHAPTLLMVQRNGSSTVSQVSPILLTWEYTSTVPADGFKIERCIGWGNCLNDVDFSEIVTISDPNATQYLDDGQHPLGLDDGQLYTYRMRSFNAQGNSAYTSTWGIYTTLRPAANFTAIAVSATQVDLSWTDVSANEGGFEISRRCNSAPVGVPCDNNYTVLITTAPNVEAFSDTTVSAASSYTYRVQTVGMYPTLPGMNSFISAVNVTTPGS